MVGPKRIIILLSSNSCVLSFILDIWMNIKGPEWKQYHFPGHVIWTLLSMLKHEVVNNASLICSLTCAVFGPFWFQFYTPAFGISHSGSLTLMFHGRLYSHFLLSAMSSKWQASGKISFLWRDVSVKILLFVASHYCW